ncbi:MAG: COX15/CtaA family protein [Mariprofundaceae bacterium]|nr:COX15/CtaA family protein [Mariprofundaceae bacterium]
MSPRLVVATLVMCVALIFASSFMHLTNTGLGSPDSYGLIAPGAVSEAGEATTAKHAILPSGIADRVHRGVANVLQILIVAVAFVAFRKRKEPDALPLFVPMAALGVSLILAFLGAWFGSPLRYPWIMMTNLIGGFTLLALFWWLALDVFASSGADSKRGDRVRTPAIMSLLVLIVAIVLGAWTDVYYAALACSTLPDCQGQWLPGLKLWEGLSMLGTLDIDAHGRVIIDQAVAADIHMAHRIGALAASAMIFWLAIRSWNAGSGFRPLGVLLLLLLLIQTVSGIVTVAAGLSVAVVVGHNLLSALLVINILTLIHRSAGKHRALS